jgi:hypothetical protein
MKACRRKETTQFDQKPRSWLLDAAACSGVACAFVGVEAREKRGVGVCGISGCRWFLLFVSRSGEDRRGEVGVGLVLAKGRACTERCG